MDERIRFEGTREAPARTASVGVLLATGLPGAAQRPLAVVGAVILIGREDDCEVILPSPRVSRRHARVWAEGDGFGVEDLGSLNGTYVNRRRVSGQIGLADGDRLTLADVELQFRVLPADAVPPVPRRPEPADVTYPRGVTTLMASAVDPEVPPAPDDLRAVHLLVALLAAVVGAVFGHVLGVGRTGALVLTLVLPLAAAAVLLRPSPRRVLPVLVLAALAAGLTVAGVTAAELRQGHALLPGVPSGGTFVTAAQVDALLGHPAPPPGCATEPSVSVAKSTQPGAVGLRLTGRCFGPGSSVDVVVGPTLVQTVHADRYGRLSTRVVVDPDASCPLGRCSVTTHELQSLRYAQAETDVANAG
jgi:hypothetical protein